MKCSRAFMDCQAITGDSLDISIDWMVEAAVAGIDLEAVADTNEAENNAEYDRLRALSPEALEQGGPGKPGPPFPTRSRITAGDRRLPLALERGIEVPEVGNVELARVSTLTLTAPLPPNDDDSLTIGWDRLARPACRPSNR